MNKNKISIVILAAGKGSRMKSSKAKVLHNISGKPMLYHIIKASKEISDDITVVIAHQKEAVKEQMEVFFDDINFSIQDADNFPGTGGAMKNIVPKNEKVLILNGDMPLITSNALQGFLENDADIIITKSQRLISNDIYNGEYVRLGVYALSSHDKKIIIF